MNLRHTMVPLIITLSSLTTATADSTKDFKLVPVRLAVQRDGPSNIFAKLRAADSGVSQREWK